MKTLSEDLLCLESLASESPILEDYDDCASHWSTAAHSGYYDIPIILPKELELGGYLDPEIYSDAGGEQYQSALTSSGSSTSGNISSSEREDRDAPSYPLYDDGLPEEQILEAACITGVPASGSSCSTIDTIGTRVFGTPLIDSPVQLSARDSTFSMAMALSRRDENGGISRSASVKTITGATVASGVGLGVMSYHDSDAYPDLSTTNAVLESYEEDKENSNFHTPNLDANVPDDKASQLEPDTVSEEHVKEADSSNKVISLETEWAPASHWQSASSSTPPISPTPRTPTTKHESGRLTPRAHRSPATRQRDAHHVRNFSRPLSNFSPLLENNTITTSISSSELCPPPAEKAIKAKRRPFSELLSRSPMLEKSTEIVRHREERPSTALPCLEGAKWLRGCIVQLWIDQEGFRAICPCFELSRVSYAPAHQLSSLPDSCRAAAQGIGKMNTEMTLLATVAEFVPSTRETFYFHHAAMDRAPCLRRVTVGKDEGRDYVHRQASLNVKTHGVYAVSGTEEHRVSEDVGNSDRIVSLHWKLEYFVNERWNERTGKLMQGERTFRPLSFTCTSMLLQRSRATKVKLLSVVKKKIISSKLAAEKVEPPMPPPGWKYSYVDAPVENGHDQHGARNAQDGESREKPLPQAPRQKKHARTISHQYSVGSEPDMRTKSHARARSASFGREKIYGCASKASVQRSLPDLPPPSSQAPIGHILPRDELLRILAEEDASAEKNVVTAFEKSVPSPEVKLVRVTENADDHVPVYPLSPPPAFVHARLKSKPVCI